MKEITTMETARESLIRRNVPRLPTSAIRRDQAPPLCAREVRLRGARVLTTIMARLSDRLPENAPGDFFVDSSCIDCATCRTLAPRVFARADAIGLSVVGCQPSSEADALRAKMALVSCPTSAIGTASKIPVRDAVGALPDPILSDVLYCGYASESSYGAASYLVVRESGNVLVDSPRAARPLMDGLEALGGVRTMFLSHVDDVADHALFARRFGCERVLHAADARGPLLEVERKLHGNEPIVLAPDLLAIPVPRLDRPRPESDLDGDPGGGRRAL